jgi:hypothetical protein
LYDIRNIKLSKKKNNHYAPQSLLRKWQTFEGRRWGVHVYDLIKNKYSFSCASGSGAFSFASKNYLYVPEVKGARKSNVEDWFCEIESTLASAIKRIEKDDQTYLFRETDDLMKFIFAIISFKHRNEYNLNSIRKKLDGNKDLQFKVSGIPNRDLNLIVLENMVNACYEDFYKYSQFELIIFSTSDDKSLIYCDRPFIEDVVDGYSFLPLTNKKFIAIRPTLHQSTYTSEKSSDQFTDSINFAIAGQSRYWIMADSRELLGNYIEEAKSSCAEEETVYKSIRYLKEGKILK